MDITLGADPEFLCLFTKGATKQLIHTNVCTTDNFTFESSYTRFGRDGCSMIFELRPQPSTNPFTVVKNISRILHSKTTMSLIGGLDWLSTPYFKGYASGGHIHFGGIFSVDSGNTFENSYQLYIGRQQMDYFDYYLGIPLCFLQPKLPTQQRSGFGYGAFSDFRSQPHGIEYRTPASWIGSPISATLVLTLAKVVSHYLTTLSVYGDDKITALATENSPYNVFGTNFTKLYQSQARIWPVIWQHIQQMPLYSQYKDWLNLIDYLITNNLTYNTDVPMKQAWGIYPIDVPNQDINKLF